MALKVKYHPPAKAHELIQAASIQLSANVASWITHLAANEATYDFLVGLPGVMTRTRTQLVDLKATPSLVAQGKTDKNDQSYDVSVEVDKLVAAIDVAVAWINANIPTDPATLSVAETAQLRTDLQAIVDEVDQDA